MRTVFGLAVLIAAVLTDPCPPKYQLMEGMCIHKLDYTPRNGWQTYGDLLQNSMQSCANANGGHLPIIKSDEENEAFITIARSFPSIADEYLWIALDLECNKKTKVLQWKDGTTVIYTPEGSSHITNYDCTLSYNNQAISEARKEKWRMVDTSDKTNDFVFLCVTEPSYIPTTTTIPPERLTVCPPEYQLMEGKCIYIYKWNGPDWQTFGDILHGAIQVCDNKHGGHLPIIKSDEENETFNTIARSIASIQAQTMWIALDLECNQKSKRLQWKDGTGVSYIPKGSSDITNYDCTLQYNNQAVSDAKKGQWRMTDNTDTRRYYIFMCVTQPTEASTTTITTTTRRRTTTTRKPTTTTKTTPTVTTTTVKPTEKPTENPTEGPQTSECGSYSLLEKPTDSKKNCIKVFTDSLSWKQAQLKCSSDFGSLVTINSAEENKFFWRTAVSYNIVDGMHIGAHQSEENPSIWEWIDGEIPFSGKVYDNFISAFPIPGVGECAAMLTDSSAAQWINEDCNEDNLPFICRRIDFSTLLKTCPTDAPNAGDDIFPPGFPDADTICSYILIVSAGKLVELEVVTLIAETDKDFLEVHEGPVGTNLLANLTGSILSSTKFKTGKSNVLRVNWKPNGAGNGRGYRIRYNEVDTS